MQSSVSFLLQDLPAEAARFCLGIERFCLHELGVPLDGQSIVVSYSGGADSKTLLLVLLALSRRLDLTLHAAILDHGFREEAAVEVADARALCARLGLRFHTEKRDVARLAGENGMGLEEAGRAARRGFLEDVRSATQSAWVATGHQLNDLAEDSLMRMLRGTGWPALGGMAGMVEESRIVRPLLLTPRADIEGFLTMLGETWHDDRMNHDDAYLRNRVRKHILPLFLKENPSFLDSVAERWRMARRDAAFFAEAAASMRPEEADGGFFLSRASLEHTPAAVRLRKYMDILALLGKGQALAAHLRFLDESWQRGEGGKRVQFPGGKTAVVHKGGILFLGANHRK